MEQAATQTSDRVVSSRCTRSHPAARDAAERVLATNPGDPETYRSVAGLETGVVEALGEVTGFDHPHGPRRTRLVCLSHVIREMLTAFVRDPDADRDG